MKKNNSTADTVDSGPAASDTRTIHEVRIVRNPQPTAALERQVRAIRDHEEKTERMLLAGDRARS